MKTSWRQFILYRWKISKIMWVSENILESFLSNWVSDHHALSCSRQLHFVLWLLYNYTYVQDHYRKWQEMTLKIMSPHLREVPERTYDLHCFWQTKRIKLNLEWSVWFRNGIMLIHFLLSESASKTNWIFTCAATYMNYTWSANLFTHPTLGFIALN